MVAIFRRLVIRNSPFGKIPLGKQSRFIEFSKQIISLTMLDNVLLMVMSFVCICPHNSLDRVQKSLLKDTIDQFGC